MEHKLEDSIAILSRTPCTLNAFLRDLPETWTRRNEGPDTMDAFDVVGHLIYGERTDWIPRAKIILQFGDAKPFEPFDRCGHRRECGEKSLPQLLDEFSRMRAENLHELRSWNLSAADLQKSGCHPELGIVTLSQLLATWAAHDLSHIHQISRIMAHQYRDAVGPWHAYLGVMKCTGHSA